MNPEEIFLGDDTGVVAHSMALTPGYKLAFLYDAQRLGGCLRPNAK